MAGVTQLDQRLRRFFGGETEISAWALEKAAG
jgi:hypothetical protein